MRTEEQIQNRIEELKKIRDSYNPITQIEEFADYEGRIYELQWVLYQRD